MAKPSSSIIQAWAIYPSIPRKQVRSVNALPSRVNNHSVCWGLIRLLEHDITRLVADPSTKLKQYNLNPRWAWKGDALQAKQVSGKARPGMVGRLQMRWRDGWDAVNGWASRRTTALLLTGRDWDETEKLHESYPSQGDKIGWGVVIRPVGLRLSWVNCDGQHCRNRGMVTTGKLQQGTATAGSWHNCGWHQAAAKALPGPDSGRPVKSSWTPICNNHGTGRSRDDGRLWEQERASKQKSGFVHVSQNSNGDGDNHRKDNHGIAGDVL